MFSAQNNPIQRFIRRFTGSRAAGDDPDRQLLQRFVAHADQGAFEALVQRHGPLVMSVCTRVLGGAHDAEDAFQATFLVLVRKAGSLRAPESLGPWLHGVAYRTALKARAQVLKRRRLEKPLVDVAAPAIEDSVMVRDLRAVLDKEVDCLPAKYRIPFVLCYLQGKTNAQAAQMLGCPQGTVFSRLAWARELLRKRIGRRLTLASGTFATLLAQCIVTEAVPLAQAVSTSKAALAFAAGKSAAAPAISAPAAALAEGVLRAMFLTKLKSAIVVLLAMGTVTAAVGVLARYLEGGEQENMHTTVHRLLSFHDEPKTDKDKLPGTWTLVALTDTGNEIPQEEIKAKNFEMVITADKLNLPPKGKQVSYKLDPSKKPKQIDLLFEGGKAAKGIYSLEGTTLKLCVSTRGSDRPTEFAAPSDLNQILLVLKKKP
jgi:RNA polymerase sigma factor (sigma-70 family)